MASGTSPLSDVFRNNVLFRLRAGSNVPRATTSRAGAGFYYTNAGVLTVAATNILRTEWLDLDVDGIREAPSYLLYGNGVNLVTDPTNLAAWTLSNTPVVTAGQADPFGGTGAYNINDDNAAADEGIFEDVPFAAGTGTRTLAIFIRAGTATVTDWRLRDETAATVRVQLRATWTVGVPSVAVVAGSGTVSTLSTGSGWYYVTYTADSVVGANTNRLLLFGATTGSAPTGSTNYYGAQAWNATTFIWQFATAGDLFSVPFNWGPSQSLTVLARLGRPLHADGVGTLGVNPRIFEIGTSAAALIGNFNSTSRQIVGQIDTATTDATQTASIPAGTPLTVTWQFKTLTTGGVVAIDVGSGLSAFSSAATAFSAFGTQTLRIGGSGGNELYGNLLDLLIVRGLVTRDRMMQIAGLA